MARKRFKVVEVVKENPVLICKVEYFEENLDADDDPEMIELANEVAGLFRKTMDLAKEQVPEEKMSTLPPTEMAYWLTTMIHPLMQQQNLEMETTEEILERLKTIFEEAMRLQAVRNSINSAFTDE